jgi:hypothetical protein
MNLRETIKKVLKEEIHNDVELIIDKFYNIKFSISPIRNQVGLFMMIIKLIPKVKGPKEIEYYSSWGLTKNYNSNGELVRQVKNYDTFEVSNLGVFSGIEKDLNRYLFDKSKEYVLENIDQIYERLN